MVVLMTCLSDDSQMKANNALGHKYNVKFDSVLKEKEQAELNDMFGDTGRWTLGLAAVFASRPDVGEHPRGTIR